MAKCTNNKPSWKKTSYLPAVVDSSDAGKKMEML